MLCKCGHGELLHAFGRNRDKQRVRMSCTGQEGFRFCKCEQFNPIGENEMAKKTNGAASKPRKPKGEGRKPTLAPYVDAPFKVYVSFDGKERDAMVLSTGIIRYKEKEFTSPSGFANAVIKEVGAKGRADGWKVVTFNKDDKRVSLDTLRGSKSPLKAEAPKAPRKAKAAKPATEKKAKAPRKPRAAKKTAKPNGATPPDITDADLPANEASAPF